jgi:hypothetical protein
MNYEKEMYHPTNPDLLKINPNEIKPLDHEAYEDLYYKERNDLPPRLRDEPRVQR